MARPVYCLQGHRWLALDQISVAVSECRHFLMASLVINQVQVSVFCGEFCHLSMSCIVKLAIVECDGISLMKYGNIIKIAFYVFAVN